MQFTILEITCNQLRILMLFPIALLDFSITDILKLDKLRRQRNGIKYYGEDATFEEAKEAVQTAEKIIHKLREQRKEL